MGKSRTTARRWFRRGLIGLLLSGFLCLVLVASAWLSLGSRDVRQTVLRRVAHEIEERAGVRAQAADFELNPMAGTLEVRDLLLGVDGEAPFARIEAVRLAWAPDSLLAGRLRFYEVEARSPRVDLGNPLPGRSAAAGGEVEPAAPPALSIGKLRIIDGSLTGPVPQAVADRVGSWTLGGIALDGEVEEGRFSARLKTARARVDLTEQGPLELALSGAAEGEIGGAIRLESLSAEGDPLTARISGVYDPARRGPEAEFHVAADPGFWLGGEAAPRVTLEGGLDLGAWRGSARLEAPDQPAGLLAQGLDPETSEALRLSATRVDLEARIELEPADGATAHISSSIRRGDEPVARLLARPSFDRKSPYRVDLPIEIALLPAEAGERRVTGRVSGSDLRRPREWTVAEGRADLDLPAVDSLVASLSRLWPDLLPAEKTAELPPLGRMSGEGRFSGSLLDPALDAWVDWRPHAGAVVRVEATGPVSGPLEVESDASALDLAHFRPGWAGRLGWRGRGEHTRGQPPRGQVTAEGAGLDFGGDARVDRLAAELRSDGVRLDWRLEGESAAHGRVDGQGDVALEAPVRKAEGELTWHPAREEIGRVVTSLTVEEGVLRVATGTPGGLFDGSLTAEAWLPLASLSDLPQLAFLKTVPLERAGGPVELDWEVPAGEWAEALPTAWRSRFASLRAGTRGRLELDLARPGRSSGWVEVRDLAVAADGREARGETPFRIDLDGGRARVEGWRVAGEGSTAELEGEVRLAESWSWEEPVADLVADLRVAAQGALDAGRLAGPPLETLSQDPVRFDLTLGGPLAELAGTLRVGAADLRMRHADLPDLELASPEVEVRLTGGEARIEQAVLGVGEGHLRIVGRGRVSDPLADASGRVEIVGALPGLDRVELPLTIREGLLVVDAGRLETGGGVGSLRLTAPLGGEPAPVRLAWEVPATDWTDLIELFAGEAPEAVTFSSRGEVTLDPRSPTASTAAVSLEQGRLVLAGRTTRFETPLVLELKEGIAEVPPLRLATGERGFDLEARAELTPGWTVGDPPAAAVSQIAVSGNGTLDAGLLRPFLFGARTEGAVDLELDLSGPPSGLGGRVRVAGREAEIVYPTPYLARITEPELVMTMVDGRVELTAGRAKLNEGTVSLTGVLADQGAGELEVELDDSLFRVDYGLLTTLDGKLAYSWGPDGSSTLGGRLTVDRGALTRAIRVDLDLLSQLLLPIDLTTTEEDPRERVALDLEVATRSGVRVKNNLGDLLLRWDSLTVTGNLARPVFEGILAVEPGGRLYAYGQTVRLDEASIEYFGHAGAEPRLTLQITTSLEDPTIGQLSGADPFRGEAAGSLEQTGERETVAAGLARFYGEQFVDRLSDAVGGVSLSLRPVLIFGETDPGARLTVSRDFSPNFAVAASVDLRDAQSQTYVLEAHELRGLPGLVGQAFTDDESEYGGVFLQRLGFGGSRKRADADLPRVGKVRFEGRPDGASKRGIRRALGVERGDPFSPSDRFVAEVEVLEYLRGRGYSEARADLTASAVEGRARRVALALAIEAGPRALVEFSGEKIPKPLRRSIAGLYRSDFFEGEAIEEMRRETVKALRSRGFLEPAVTIAVEAAGAGELGGSRKVRVHTEGGTRIRPEPPLFLGVPDEEAEYLGKVFAGPVQRVELAVGLPVADRQLLAALRTLGFVEPKITRRHVSLEDRRLTVEIEAGPRLEIASLDLEGVEPPEADRLRGLIGVVVGGPVRSDVLTAAAFRMERDLSGRGYPAARARVSVQEVAGADRLLRAVRFTVDSGPLTRIEGVEVAGARSTRPKFVRKVTGLETGAVYARDAVARARTNLWRTGLFSAIDARTAHLGDGLTRVSLDLAERDRYEVAYGVRWESGDGTSTVVELTDRNFLGRNLTMGLRALYSDDDRSLRWVTRVPRAFTPRGTLELFAVARELVEVGIVSDVLEGTLQYSLPIGKRQTLRPYLRHQTTRLREEEPDPFFPLDETIRSPLLGLQYVYDSRRGELLAERGTFTSVDLSGSEEFLDGDFRYARIFGQVNLFRPFGGARRPLVWAQSFRLGFAEAFDQELLRDVRFFSGGEYSVRGYETDSLGPMERLGSVVRPLGGEALLVVNQELRWRLLDRYALSAFVDAGNVWRDASDFGSSLVTSVGIGARAVTPVGLLRLDLAHALDRRPGVDPEFKLYFGLGSTF